MATVSLTNAFRFGAVALIACATPTPIRADAPRTTASEPHDGQHDFDFMFGRWNVKIRRLKRPLSGANEWIEMTGTSVCRPIWDSQGNIEEIVNTLPDGTKMEALMVRLYSPASHQWALNWVNRKTPRFDVPTIGEFKNGRGEFFDQENFEGRSIFVRYAWSDMTAKSAHFEQAFSPDGGKTWEVNWIAQSTRAD
jgi:hypothetical protein